MWRRQVAGVSGSAWVGTLKNLATGAVTPIGTLFLPSGAWTPAGGGQAGFGDLQVAALDFQEYFLGSGCAGQVRGGWAVLLRGPVPPTLAPSTQSASGVGLFGPWFTTASGAQITPTEVRWCGAPPFDRVMAGLHVTAPLPAARRLQAATPQTAPSAT